MKILVCIYEYPPLGGGGGVIADALARELAKKHHVTVITSGLSNSIQIEEQGDLRIVRLPVLGRKDLDAASFISMFSFIVQTFLKSKFLVENFSADIVNTHFVLPSGPAGHILAKMMNVPNIITVHGGDLYDPSKFLSPHRHWLFRKAISYYTSQSSYVVAQSCNTMHNLIEYFGYEGPRMIIPLGIERQTAVVAHDSYPERAKTNTKVKLVTVGRLVPRKGLEQLIRIVSKLNDLNVELYIVGHGPERSSLEEQAQALGLESAIKFCGRLSEEEKISTLMSADIYVSTSQHEGFGLVFLEAWDAGLPVICYNHGGQTDFIEDGINGFLVELNDEEAFTDKIRAVINDKELKHKMSAAASERVQSFYIDTCAAQYEKLFEKVVQDTGVQLSNRSYRTST